jgi:hypothetical protein
MDCQDTPDSVFIHIQSKGQIDLLGNARASVSRVVPFHLDDGIESLPRIIGYYFLGRAFWPGFLAATRRIQRSIFAFYQCVVKGE